MSDNTNMVSLSSEVIETVIGGQTRFKGNVKTNKPIRIDGVFEGDIDSTNLVLITESGRVKGNIKCSELQLKGTGEGTAHCTELMQFAATGSFAGDITVGSLITVPGAFFNGSCRMAKTAAAPETKPEGFTAL
ncbi:MAG: polymer-forming cytoskeletal protein [Clostridia bacterium]|nr:polymer-forming cytoskeletal protein [Clostridia bacterium]